MTTGHNFWHWAVFHIEKVCGYITLFSRVRGPYGKLWTEFFFPSFYENKEGKNLRGSITCRTDQANKANKMFVI